MPIKTGTPAEPSLLLTLCDSSQVHAWSGIERPKDETKPYFSACSTDVGFAYVAFITDDIIRNKSNIRRLAVRFRRHVIALGYRHLHIVGQGVQDPAVELFLEALFFDNYAYAKYSTKESGVLVLEDIYVAPTLIDPSRLERLIVLSERINTYRDLVNTPPSDMTATHFAETLEMQAKTVGVQTEVWLPKRIAEERMGGLLAVNRGSLEHARLIQMHWRHPQLPKDAPLIVLVGKGVTFDSGGMNLKTGHYMDDMKQDMTGGALMSQVLLAAAQLRLPVALTALIPATDNMPFSGALLPGDIITMRNGTTVEVANTDAEGRLILADALDLAKQFAPALVMEAATLTGSASRAIGSYAVVAMQKEASKALDHLKTLGDQVDERVVEFPLWEAYDDQLQSDIADMKNCGDGDGGAITAARFLSHFVDYPFIHLDMAGVAFSKKSNDRQGPGATGFGLTSLLTFIETYNH